MATVSFLHALFLFHERDDFAEIIHHRLQLRDGFGGEVLRFGQFIGVLERVVLEPGDIELVAAFLDLADVEFAESTGLSGIGAFAQAVGSLP